MFFISPCRLKSFSPTINIFCICPVTAHNPQRFNDDDASFNF